MNMSRAIFYVYPTKFVAGLCAYVRQAALSIDRAFGDDFQAELCLYYSQKSSPPVNAVFSALRQLGERRVFPVTAMLFSQFSCLTKLQVDQIESALIKLEHLLEEKEVFSQAQRMSLRLELSYLEVALSRKVPKSCVDSIRFIEHYHQSKRLQPKSLCEIAGKEWPLMAAR